MASVAKTKAGGAYIELSLNDAKLVKGLNKIRSKITYFGDTLTAMGTKITLFGAAAATPFGIMTKQFAAFDDQMRLAKAVVGATDEELKILTETAEKLGATTSYTSAQVAEGMVALARMGFAVNEVNSSIKNFMDLDKATGMNNLAQTAEIGAAAMRSFGIAANETNRIADVLTTTANSSAQTLEDVGEALKYAAPNAAMANATLEDTCAMLGVLANLGIKGSMAGTALAKSFERLSSGTGLNVLAKQGIKTKDGVGNLRNMRDILIDIAKAAQKMGSADKIAFFTDIFDVRGAKGGGLISGNLQELDAMMGKIASSGGVAAKTALEMESGIGGAVRLLSSSYEALTLAIGNAVGNGIMPLMNKISEILAGMAIWIKQNEEVVYTFVKIVMWAVGIGGALLALGATFKVVALAFGVAIGIGKAVLWPFLKGIPLLIKAIIFSLGLLKTAGLIAWSVLTSPITAYLAAIAGVLIVIQKLTGAFTPLSKVFGKLGSDFMNCFSTMKKYFGATFNAIVNALKSGDLGKAAEIGMSYLKLGWVSAIGALEKAWGGFVLWVKDVFYTICESIELALNNLYYEMIIVKAKLFHEDTAEFEEARDNSAYEIEEEYKVIYKENRTAYDNTIKAIDEEIAAAIKELDVYLNEKQGIIIEKPAKDLPRLAKQAQTGVNEMMLEITYKSSGNFFADAFRGAFGGIGTAEKTLKATEEVARNTKNMNEKISNLKGLQFT